MIKRKERKGEDAGVREEEVSLRALRLNPSPCKRNQIVLRGVECKAQVL